MLSETGKWDKPRDSLRNGAPSESKCGQSDTEQKGREDRDEADLDHTAGEARRQDQRVKSFGSTGGCISWGCTE